jgi:hypothetical protein
LATLLFAPVREPEKEGVRNSIKTVPDTLDGRANRTRATRNYWPTYGPSKIFLKLVVALLPFTVLARSVRTLFLL